MNLPARNRSLPVVACLLACAALAGCSRTGNDSERDRAAVEAFDSRDEMTKRLDRVLEESKRLTSETVAALPDGTTLPARKRIVRQSPRIAPTNSSFKSVAGAIFGTLILTESAPPSAIALTDDGSLVIASRGTTRLHTAEGVETILLPFAADYLAFNHEGNTLLAQRKSDVVFLSGADLKQVRRIDPHPVGRAMWNGADEGLLFVEEDINFSASEKYRVNLHMMMLDTVTGRTTAPNWSAEKRYSAIGTLAPAGMTWGHLIQHYMIDAIPAPLYLLDGGTPIAALTETTSAADIDPVADVHQNLLWVRTYRRGENSGRALYRRYDVPPGNALQLTNTPTFRVALSPDGTAGSICILNESNKYEIRQFVPPDLPLSIPVFEGYAQEDTLLREKIFRVVDHVREEFIRTNPGGGAMQVELGSILKSPPKPEEIDRMGDALTDALKTEFAISLSPDATGLGQLDDFFEVAGSYMSDEPAMVLAVASHLSRRAGAKAPWVMDENANALSADDPEILKSDGYSYIALAPFAVARERITGSQSLTAALFRVTNEGPLPIYFVENFREDVLDTIVTTEIKSANSSVLSSPPARRLEIFRSVKGNNSALDFAVTNAARQSKDTTLALLAAMRLAEKNPTSGKALAELGTSLHDTFYSDDAERVFAAAVVLDPLDIDVRFAYADCLAGIDKVNDARIQYLIIQKLDVTKSVADELQGRLELLASMASGPSQ